MAGGQPPGDSRHAAFIVTRTPTCAASPQVPAAGTPAAAASPNGADFWGAGEVIFGDGWLGAADGGF